MAREYILRHGDIDADLVHRREMEELARGRRRARVDQRADIGVRVDDPAKGA